MRRLVPTFASPPSLLAPRLKTARTALGLWHPSAWDHPAQLRDFQMRTLQWSGREVKLSYIQFANLLVPGATATLREWTGRINCERTGVLLGTVELMLLRRAARSKQADEVLSALRGSGNTTARDWSNALEDALLHGEPLEAALSSGPLVLLSRLETCPVAAPRGLGTWAARRVFALMSKRHGSRLAFLRPFPLQFEFAEQIISRRTHDARWRAFDEARAALSSHYVRHLAARPLGDGPVASWLLVDLKA